MEAKQPQQSLPKALLKLLTRRSALFFQRLVLMESKEDSSTSVRHYDHECEGIEMLFGFLKTKHQNALLKAFDQIREYPKVITVVSVPVTSRCLKGITTRTDLRSNCAVSECAPAGDRPLLTFRSAGGTLTKYATQRQGSSDMEKLLQKVRQVNSHADTNYSYRRCLSRKELTDNSNFWLNKGQRSHANLITNNTLLQPSSSRMTGLLKPEPYSTCSVYSELSSYREAGPTYGGRGDQNLLDVSIMSRRQQRRDLILQKFDKIEEELGIAGPNQHARAKLNTQILREIDSIKKRLRL